MNLSAANPTVKRALPALIALVPIAGLLSFRALWIFGWGYARSQEWWDADVFVWWMMSGFVLAFVAVAAAEAARRLGGPAIADTLAARAKKLTRSDIASELVLGIGPLVLLLVRVLFGAQVIAYLACNSGPARTVIIVVFRVVATWGMATDLPIPSQPAQ